MLKNNRDHLRLLDERLADQMSQEMTSSYIMVLLLSASIVVSVASYMQVRSVTQKLDRLVEKFEDR